MTDKRDPRVDPKAGDEVMFGPQWQTERYTVLGTKDQSVHYQMGPMRAILTCTIDEWREWSKGGEILNAAE